MIWTSEHLYICMYCQFIGPAIVCVTERIIMISFPGIITNFYDIHYQYEWVSVYEWVGN